VLAVRAALDKKFIAFQSLECDPCNAVDLMKAFGGASPTGFRRGDTLSDSACTWHLA
jgi:hypothetical protein